MSNYRGFTTVQLRRPERSAFDLSHEKRLSTKMGKLTPILIQEALPNDTFTGQTEMLLRLAPTIAPFMHRVNAFIHYFFVPNRLLWEEWEDFITKGESGDSEPVPPYALGVNIRDFAQIGMLPDYFGLDPEFMNQLAMDPVQFQMMPFAAFYQIWYDYYRDRNFTPDNDFLPLPSGEIPTLTSAAILETRYRAWQHDYFTSALPFTQRGNEVLMPLQGSATMVYSSITGDPAPTGSALATSNLQAGRLVFADDVNPVTFPEDAEIRLTSSDVSINDLRQAVRLQEWYERNALAGSRMNESIMAHFGRRTSDARLQRAEYLGGGKVTIKVNEVVNTAWSEDAAANKIPAGTMSGHAIAYSNEASFKYNCEEWGFIIGILSVMPVTAYQQGIPRMFARRSFLDYPWPSFAHLGEQPVYDWEIYGEAGRFTPSPTTNEYPIFGYQSRYADWKHALSTSHGDFRTTLDFYHLTRKFTGLPALGNQFNTLDPEEVERIFAVQDSTDNLWIYLYNKLNVKRALPYFGTPML